MVKIALYIVVLMFSLSAQAVDNFYRYTNAKGVLVIDHKVPPELVHKGYEVINRNGEIIKTVEAYDPDDVASRQLRQVDEKQRREDLFMLRSYSTLEDLHSNRDRKIKALEGEIYGIKNTLRDFIDLLDAEKQKAANMQRSGRDISDATREHIQHIDSQLDEVKAALQLREAELETMRADFRRQEQRFVELKGLDQ